MTTTLTLTDFLLARYAEEERQAANGVHGRLPRFDPARVLAECEAKRRIVGHPETYWHTIRLLALPYADHPDYRDEWRP